MCVHIWKYINYLFCNFIIIIHFTQASEKEKISSRPQPSLLPGFPLLLLLTLKSLPPLSRCLGIHTQLERERERENYSIGVSVCVCEEGNQLANYGEPRAKLQICPPSNNKRPIHLFYLASPFSFFFFLLNRFSFFLALLFKWMALCKKLQKLLLYLHHHSNWALNLLRESQPSQAISNQHSIIEADWSISRGHCLWPLTSCE